MVIGANPNDGQPGFQPDEDAAAPGGDAVYRPDAQAERGVTAVQVSPPNVPGAWREGRAGSAPRGRRTLLAAA